MSEWFYLRRWRSQRETAWSVVDENNKFCVGDYVLMTRSEAEEVAREINQKTGNKVYIVHQESEKYMLAKGGKIEDNQNEQRA